MPFSLLYENKIGHFGIVFDKAIGKQVNNKHDFLEMCTFNCDIRTRLVNLGIFN